METPLRLYSFQPKGHGELSFFVAAASEAEARASVDKYIAEKLSPPGFQSDARGWGTDYYEVEEFNPGEVATNPND